MKNERIETVLANFKDISTIPRGSGNEARIGEWLEIFGKKIGLSVIRDAYNNVVFFKPGQNGGENAPALILQAHSDMVCAKSDDSEHNFEKDPIRLIEKDGWLSASGTTLGADNGLGMAFICMLLADKTLRHPPLEALVTTAEEVGMDGMRGVDASRLTARRMINLDAEENGVLIASCAGGARSELTLPVTRSRPEKGYAAYKIALSGLAGGHSGVEIHKGCGNAILLLGRMMKILTQDFGIQSCGLYGGTGSNVIPSKGELVFYADPQKHDMIAARAQELGRMFLSELPTLDRGLCIEMNGGDSRFFPLTAECSSKVSDCISLLPNGAIRYHETLPGQVSLSSNSGTIKTDEQAIYIQSLTRGNVNTSTEYVVDKLRGLAELCGGRLEVGNRYGAWEYAPKSMLRELALRSFKRQTGTDMTVTSIHGGLECALMAQKIPGLDMISLGPTLYDVHTPTEHFALKTAEEFWTYLLGLISQELS